MRRGVSLRFRPGARKRTSDVSSAGGKNDGNEDGGGGGGRGRGEWAMENDHWKQTDMLTCRLESSSREIGLSEWAIGRKTRRKPHLIRFADRNELDAPTTVELNTNTKTNAHSTNSIPFKPNILVVDMVVAVRRNLRKGDKMDCRAVAVQVYYPSYHRVPGAGACDCSDAQKGV